MSKSAKRVATIKAKYGEDFYKHIGRIGGFKTPDELRGFSDSEVARKAGKKSKKKKLAK